MRPDGPANVVYLPTPSDSRDLDVDPDGAVGVIGHRQVKSSRNLETSGHQSGRKGTLWLSHTERLTQFARDPVDEFLRGDFALCVLQITAEKLFIVIDEDFIESRSGESQRLSFQARIVGVKGKKAAPDAISQRPWRRATSR